MLALIDGDIVRYRTGFASNDVDERIALWRANETMEQILRAVEATEYRVYLSDSKENNYRYKLYPRYKESREKQPKPRHHEALKDFLIQEWGAIVTPGQEADDALGIDQTIQKQLDDAGDSSGPYNLSSVICSIDKDLLQVPGLHYNWVKDEEQEISEDEGIRRFYAQCLTGDRTDDILGISGIGPVKAAKALAGANSESDLFNIVRAMWGNDEALLLTGQLLWVRRREGELWEFPVSTTRDTTQKSPSSLPTLREIGPCSAHGFQETSGAPEHGSPMEDTQLIDSQDST